MYRFDRCHICKISKTCFNDEIASYLSFHPHDTLNVVNFAFIRMFRDNSSIIFCFRWVVQKIFIFSKKEMKEKTHYLQFIKASQVKFLKEQIFLKINMIRRWERIVITSSLPTMNAIYRQ